MMKGKVKWLLLIVSVIALDQVCKFLVVQHLMFGQPYELLPILNFTYVHNLGAAFSFLGSASGWQRYLFIGIGIGVPIILLVWLSRLKQNEKLLSLALSLVIGGALGNVIDRIRLGYVIDFVELHYKHYVYPIFNVADMGITFGVIILIFCMLRK